jgi:single-stranded-DNA-specific exonuclease
MENPSLQQPAKTPEHSGSGRQGNFTPDARWVCRGGVTSAQLPLLERIWASRGLEDAEVRQRFTHPEMRLLHDPSLMPGIDRAADRLCRAIRDGERIVIYGDYDVDGITASAILFHAIRTLRPDSAVSTYVPHRIDEGYGLNAEALIALAEKGAAVIVTVDCGITARGPAAALRSAAPHVDLIITDHHHVPEESEYPACFALVHPRLAGSKYPFGELCGAGVAYKLAWRLGTLWSGSDRVPPAYRTLLVELLALASMGVIADVVPLVDENRVLAAHGLRRIRSSPLPGLAELVTQSGLSDEKILAEDVGFKLAPRLNAVGRLGHAREALEMLTTAPPARAIKIAAELTRQNDLRRAIEREIFEQAVEMVHANGMHRDDQRAIVLRHTDWHPGVVGIVCSRLVERFHRPAMLLCERDGLCAGSGRSIDGFNLHGALSACSQWLETFGGHDMAAGLKVTPEKFAGFQQAMIAHAATHIAAENLRPALHFDCDARWEEVNLTVARGIRTLEPFGRDNPPVRLRMRGVPLDGRPRTMGAQQQHLQLTLGTGTSRIRAVGWRKAEAGRDLPIGARLDLIVQLNISTWTGSETLEAEIIDLRQSSNQNQ